MKSIFETSEHRDEVRSGDRRDEVFAARLLELHAHLIGGSIPKEAA